MEWLLILLTGNNYGNYMNRFDSLDDCQKEHAEMLAINPNYKGECAFKPLNPSTKE